jgi:hypothetical protein
LRGELHAYAQIVDGERRAAVETEIAALRREESLVLREYDNTLADLATCLRQRLYVSCEGGRYHRQLEVRHAQGREKAFIEWCDRLCASTWPRRWMSPHSTIHHLVAVLRKNLPPGAQKRLCTLTGEPASAEPLQG